MDINELIDNLMFPSWHDLEDPDATLDSWVDIAGYAALGGEIMSGGDSNACIGD